MAHWPSRRDPRILRMTAPMKFQHVPARRGALWVRQGFRVFYRQPLAFAALFACFLFGLFVLTLVPWLGSALLLGSLPLASLGFMLATKQALDGRFPKPRVFAEPLRSGRQRAMTMLQLGAIYAVATLLIMWLSDVVDRGALDALMDTLAAGQPDPQAINARLSDPLLEVGLLMRVGLATLLSLPFWHAPALAHWGGQRTLQALFFSTVACWRNKGAFTVFGLAWVAVVMLFGVLANLVFAVLGQAPLIALAAMPASLIFTTVFYASLYFTFADCFVPEPAAAEPTPERMIP